MSAKGGKTPTTKMKEVKSMAKKIGIIVLLCFSLCVGGVSAFANEGHDETDTQTLIETQPPVSSVLFRQDGADIQQSTDEGKTWQSYAKEASMVQSVTYQSETKTVHFQGKSIVLESLTPVLSPKEKEKRKKEIERCLYEVFSKYRRASDTPA